MSETEATGDGRPWALCRTVGAYSGGTRVEIIDHVSNTVTVRVIATDALIDVHEKDLVKLRRGTDLVPA